MTVPRGLLDTSVIIAFEAGRALDDDAVPTESLISAVTLAEIHAGVIAAPDVEARSRRIHTLTSLARFQVLTVDARAAQRWAVLRARLAEEGRRMNVNDLWIAAVALANDLPVVTQEADFDPIEDLGGPEVIRV